MEGVKLNRMAAWLALAGLVIMAGGGLVYANSLAYGSYGLGAAGLGLLLVLAAAAMGRKELGRLFALRSVRLGLGSGAAVLAVLATVLFLGALSTRVHHRFDLSKGGQHTLAPQTLKVLQNLPKPVKAIAFFKNEQVGRQAAQERLDQYAYACPKFTYRFVDPDENPVLAKRYGASRFGTLVLVMGDKDQKVTGLDEQAITNALVRLVRSGKKKVYFVVGHGERGLDDIGRTGYSLINKALEDEGFAVAKLVLAQVDKVPDDASVVILAGPKKPLMELEKKRLGDYLARGGSLMVMVDPLTDPGLGEWLKLRGAVLGDNLVIDLQSEKAKLPLTWPMAMEYGLHKITEGLDRMLTVFPVARSVEMTAKLPKGVTGVSLIKTGKDSWAETDLTGFRQKAENAKDFEVAFNKGKDQKGPISLAVILKLPGKKPAKGAKDAKRPTARLLVVGDSDFANNTALVFPGNSDFFLNSVSYLAKEEDLVTIRPKRSGPQPLFLQPWQAALLFWVPVVVLPGLFLALGVWVVLRRRRPVR